jgi:simple sugar transport system ATP-binding protein
LIDLAARGGAVLVISQDLDELAGIADRIAVMFQGRLSAPLDAEAATRQQLGLLMGGSASQGTEAAHAGA